MLRSEKSLVEKLGEIIGFFAGYIFLTLMWFLILKFFKRIPNDWEIYQVSVITLTLVLIGSAISKYFK